MQQASGAFGFAEIYVFDLLMIMTCASYRLYVTDREGSRILVFQPSNGTFLRQVLTKRDI